MAKRFTDTEKYKKPFYRKLPGAYKLLWDFICHDCDHAGIWHVDKEIAEIYIGRDMEFDLDIALKLFNDGEKRVEIINDGSKWFIRTFIEFQYGELNPSNRVHFSILAILKKNKIKPLISPLKGAKYKDKDKDKDKDFLGEFPELNLDAWERWIAYKKKIKDPYKTENGERTKIKALIKLSDGGMSLQDKIVTQAQVSPQTP